METITVMGSPISPGTASEIARVINKSSGQIILYDFEIGNQNVKNLETEATKIGMTWDNRGSSLEAPYSDIQMGENPPRIYRKNWRDDH